MLGKNQWRGVRWVLYARTLSPPGVQVGAEVGLSPKAVQGHSEMMRPQRRVQVRMAVSRGLTCSKLLCQKMCQHLFWMHARHRAQSFSLKWASDSPIIIQARSQGSMAHSSPGAEGDQVILHITVCQRQGLQQAQQSVSQMKQTPSKSQCASQRLYCIVSRLLQKRRRSKKGFASSDVPHLQV